MNRHTFLAQCNPRPQDIPPFSQPGFFFNNPDHLRQQGHEPLYLLSAVNALTGQADARCAFFIQSNQAISPAAAPFGSVECTADLPVAVLTSFLTFLDDTVRKLEVARLTLVHYPRWYAPEQTDQLVPILLQHGFTIISAHPSSYLSVDSFGTAHHFAPTERRRLTKGQNAGFTFAHWSSPDLTEALRFIQSTRQQQGYPLTIQLEQLATLIHTFPAQFDIFTVRDGTRLIALAVTVRVRPDILYAFLPASDPAYGTFSPMVMLMAGLIDYCRLQTIRLLDLGVSLDGNRQPKPSLLRFKRNLGAQESPKYVFGKTF